MGRKGCCCIYLRMEGGRGTAQCLFLIWQPKQSWFPSNFLEALSHMLTKLSLLSNSVVPSLGQDCLGKVQLEHRVTTRQRITNPISATGCSMLEGVTLCSLCQAVASCSAGRSPALVLGNQAPFWSDSRPAPDEWEHFLPAASMCGSKKLPGVFISQSV